MKEEVLIRTFKNMDMIEAKIEYGDTTSDGLLVQVTYRDSKLGDQMELCVMELRNLGYVSVLYPIHLPGAEECPEVKFPQDAWIKTSIGATFIIELFGNPARRLSAEQLTCLMRDRKLIRPIGEGIEYKLLSEEDDPVHVWMDCLVANTTRRKE